jgi:hypothetical protein
MADWCLESWPSGADVSAASGTRGHRPGPNLFLVTNRWQGRGEKSETGVSDLGGTSRLLEKTRGRIVAELATADPWNDQLGGLVSWCGDRCRFGPACSEPLPEDL